MSLVKGIIITDHNYENVIKVHKMLMKRRKKYHLRDKSELVEKGYLKLECFKCF
jgi:hypothetical protein